MGARPGDWFVSSYSNATGTCVEVRFRDTLVDVRDSKDRSGPVLTVSDAEWTAFLADVDRQPARVAPDRAAHARTDGRSLAAEPTTDGGAVLHTGGTERLVFTDAEWIAYRRGVRAGEFSPPDTATQH
ncbi:DUF397 domain-containing protein [Pseudonocardia sp. HH130630-07]|uniref:DUF397 domain-containing protein n=1 Tax=Pseudonocardia sp. HH130630-07 TaxID=1690815 RepID=UPI0008152881|nr:DUF397 domain-containing protein [Pseudonocardia sp. HH130630-07]ANY06646.1 hypothetical protein AFB00_10450 [Pseudonocardia sp. HH130630-07]